MGYFVILNWLHIYVSLVNNQQKQGCIFGRYANSIENKSIDIFSERKNPFRNCGPHRCTAVADADAIIGARKPWKKQGGLLL